MEVERAVLWRKRAGIVSGGGAVLCCGGKVEIRVSERGFLG